MNGFDFWFFGPASIWFLSAVILSSTIAWLINNNRNTNKIVSGLGRDISELKNSTFELRKDLEDLGDDTSKLRTSIDNFYQTLQKAYWWIR